MVDSARPTADGASPSHSDGRRATAVGPWSDLRVPGWHVRVVDDLAAVGPTPPPVVVLHEDVASTAPLPSVAGLVGAGDAVGVVASCCDPPRVTALLAIGVHEIVRPGACGPAELADAMARARIRAQVARRAAADQDRRIRHARDRETAATGRLRVLGEDQRRFVSGLSHEIRTPLTSILGFTNLLESSSHELSPERREACVRAIGVNAERLRLMLDDVLLLQNPDDLHLEREPVLLRSLVRDVVGLVRRGVTHNLVPGELTAYADRRRLLRVLEAVVGNVERHAGADATLTVDAATGPDGVALELVDDGPGIPEELCEDVFRPFLQGDGQASGVQGVGLGLAVAATITEAHGGRISAEAPPGGGTRVTIMLPAGPAS